MKMATEVVLPRIDAGMTQGTIVEWRKKKGDWVKKGEILYVLETEKVSVEVEAPESGVLSEVMAKAGDVVTVGTVVAFLLQVGEKVPEIPGQVKVAIKEGIPAAPKIETAEKFEAAQEATPIKASPLAKRMAKEHNIDLSGIEGTGPEGRITKEDIMQAIDGAKKTATGPIIQEEILPLSSMRRTIARRMIESFQSAPHFYLTVEVDTEELRKAREKLRPSIEKITGVRLTYTDLLIKIVADSIEGHPGINVRWGGDGIERLRDINIGLAIAVEDGLIVPVIRQANAKSLVEIVRIRADFGQRAEEGKIRLDEMRGGSLTLTNLGMFGIDQFSAIINPPESSILAIGRIADRPVVHNGQIVIRPRMNLTFSIDHRVLDGVSGSRFLKRIKELIEQPLLLI
jgi:pyruvate dehydrogenase E2 component (dihydrolipoamide acetyltransferase)